MAKIKQEEMSVKGMLNGLVKTLWAIVGVLFVTVSSIVVYNWDDVKSTVKNTSDAVQVLAVQVALANSNMEHVLYITHENKEANTEQDKRIEDNIKILQEHEYQIKNLNRKVFPKGF